jgi:hypothetical protein
MRDQRSIEREIDVARHDLEARLTELKEVLRGKLDVKQQARNALARGKEQAKQLAGRGRLELRVLGQRVRSRARSRPELVIAALAGLLVVGLLIAHRRRR